MHIIVDTHSFLWFLSGSAELSNDARQIIADTNNQVSVSVAALWEIAIKVNIGKLELTRPFHEFIPEQLAVTKIEILPITLEHLAIVANLPLHHRDPFDRLLIAQAIAESLPIVSKDSIFPQYGINLIW
ncbi:MAG: type II toxin-antitoxin system VapC family toxin [Caldilineaceae bacterium]